MLDLPQPPSPQMVMVMRCWSSILLVWEERRWVGGGGRDFGISGLGRTERDMRRVGKGWESLWCCISSGLNESVEMVALRRSGEVRRISEAYPGCDVM